MLIYLVRHGKKEGDSDILNDALDGDLTKEGVKQAEKLAERMKTEPIEVIVSSAKKRAVQTAEILRKNHSKVKQIDIIEDIRPRKVGEFEGQPKEALKKKAEERGVPAYLYRPAGGESFEDVYKTAKKVYDHIVSTYKGKNILVVGHKGFNKAFIGAATQLGIPEANRLEQSEAGLTILEVGNYRVAKALVVNDTKHLDP